MSHLPMEVDTRGVRRVAGMKADCAGRTVAGWAGLHMNTSMNSR